MTRDEVLDEALSAIANEVSWCGCTGAIEALKSKPPAVPERLDPWAMSPEELLAALLSARKEMANAQEKTEEVTALRMAAEAKLTTTNKHWREEAARAAELLRQVREMEFEVECPGTLVGVDLCGKCRTCITKERDALRALHTIVAGERDELLTRLAKLDQAAKDSIARVAALTAEVKHREWVDKGAPMSGELSGDPPDAHGWRPTGDPYWWTKP